MHEVAPLTGPAPIHFRKCRPDPDVQCFPDWADPTYLVVPTEVLKNLPNMNKLGPISAVILLFTSSASRGQSFEKYISGPYAQVGTAIQQTSDGGFILAGHTGSFGTTNEYDLYLVRTDATGALLWTRTFGREASDLGYAVKQTSDGGFLMTGFSDSTFAAVRDLYLVRTDQNGDLMWSRTYGGPGYETGYGLALTADGGAIVVGESHYPNPSDVYVVRTDNMGDTLWTRTFDSGAEDLAYSVCAAAGGGFSIVGASRLTNWHMVLLHISDAGNLTWNKELSLGDYGEGRSVIATADGGILVAGELDNDACLVKADATGNLLWAKTYGMAGYDVAYAVQQTLDGGFVVSGFQDNRTWLLRTDAAGDTLWQHTYSIGLMAPNGVAAISSGGYAICSNQLNALQFVRTDADGNITCDLSANAIAVNAVTPDEASPALTSARLSGMNTPLTVTGTGGVFTTPCESSGLADMGTGTDDLIKPNPASGHCSVSFGSARYEALQVVSMQGAVLLHMDTHGRYQVEVPLEDLAQGVYAIRLIGPGHRNDRLLVVR